MYWPQRQLMPIESTGNKWDTYSWTYSIVVITLVVITNEYKQTCEPEFEPVPRTNYLSFERQWDEEVSE
jgi:hypothetical protein